MSKDIFVAPFALHLRHVGTFNPAVQSYTVSMKYDMTEFKSTYWRDKSLNVEDNYNIVLDPPSDFNSVGMPYYKIFDIIDDMTSKNVGYFNRFLKHLPTPLKICQYLNVTYLDNRYALSACISDCMAARQDLSLNFYTVSLLSTFLDTYYLFEDARMHNRPGNPTHRPLFEIYPPLRDMRRLLLDKDLYSVMVQLVLKYKQVRFQHYLRTSLDTFDSKLDVVLDEVHAYIPRFITQSYADQPPGRDKRAILSGLFTVASAAFSAYKFWRDYRHQQYMRRVMPYIIRRQNLHHKGILANKAGLVTLTQMTSEAFKKTTSALNDLRATVVQNFQVHSAAIYYNAQLSITLKDRMLHFASEMDKADHKMESFSLRMESTKAMLYDHVRNFVSGLHVLSENTLPESILHATDLKILLNNVRDELSRDGHYSLLFGDQVFAYYHLPIATGLIVDDMLYIALTLPLKRMDVNLMSIFEVITYPLPVNMSGAISDTDAYTQLQVDSKFFAFNDDYYLELTDDFVKHTVNYRSLYVPRNAMLLRTDRLRHCVLNILDRRQPEVIAATCKFQYYQALEVSPSLVTTDQFYYLMNVHFEVKIICKAIYKSKSLMSRSLTVVRKEDLCQCDLVFGRYLIFGDNQNCTPTTSVKLQFTYNYVTEWFNFGDLLETFYNGFDLIDDPAWDSSFPDIQIDNTADDTQVYNKPKPEPLDLTSLTGLLDSFKEGKDIYLSEADKLAASRSNDSDPDSLEWMSDDFNFDLFIFICSILGLLATSAVIFLCVRYGKVYAALFLRTQTAEAASLHTYTSCSFDHTSLYTHIYYALQIFLVLYLVLQLLRLLWKHYGIYKNTMFFWRTNNTALKGPPAQICLEICSPLDVMLIQLGILRTPAPLLVLHGNISMPTMSIVDITWFGSTLQLDAPIILRHRECARLLTLPQQAPLSLFQTWNLKKLMSQHCMVRLVVIQMDLLTPISYFAMSFTARDYYLSFHTKLLSSLLPQPALESTAPVDVADSVTITSDRCNSSIPDVEFSCHSEPPPIVATIETPLRSSPSDTSTNSTTMHDGPVCAITTSACSTQNSQPTRLCHPAPFAQSAPSAPSPPPVTPAPQKPPTPVTLYPNLNAKICYMFPEYAV